MLKNDFDLLIIETKQFKFENKMPQTPLVSIVCITYNHARFIRDALDGFVMQKTNFSFEILVNDDASTDGTADIVREYEARYPNLFHWSTRLKINGEKRIR